MSGKKAALVACAWIAGLGSIYAVLAMFTQAMLGGGAAEPGWWDRFYIWWVDFLGAGLLLMLAIYLGRKARRVDRAEESTNPRTRWRVALFPLGQLLLTGCLYFSDLAWYVSEHPANSKPSLQSSVYMALSISLIAAAAIVFWRARRLGAPPRSPRLGIDTMQ